MDVLSPRAYAIDAGDDNWVAAYRLTSRLLRGGARVLVATDRLAPDGLAPGTFVVPLSRSFDLWFDGLPTAEEVHRAASDADVPLTPLDETDRLIAAPLRAVRVGLYGGGGAPFNHAAILAACGFPVRFLSDAEVRAGALAEVDVFVIPGGGFRAMHGQIEPLGEEGCRAIAEWVRRGGLYIGCCAGSYDCIVNTDSFLRTCPAQGHLQLINAGPWRSDGAVEFLDLQSPGVGVVRIRNERPDHPVMFGMPDELEIAHYNGPVLDPLPARTVEGASAAFGLATFAGWTDRFTPAEAFAGPPNGDAPTYLARAAAAGRFSIVAGEYGIGRAVAFGSHPEFGFDLPMIEWAQPARMLANAVIWQAMSTGTRPVSPPVPTSGGRISLPAGSALAEVPAATDALIERVHALQQRPIDPIPGWLKPDYALSIFGLPPDRIWRQSLSDIESLAGEATSLSDRLRGRIAEIVSMPAGDVEPPLLDALLQIERWTLDERPPEWGQDGGYQGVLALLRTATRMGDAALANWHVALGPPDGPYGYADENPYHLVAGSYLAAIGCVAGAVQLLRALDAELTTAEWLASVRRREPVAAGRSKG
jgi:Biotin-protein ligase, N terminal